MSEPYVTQERNASILWVMDALGCEDEGHGFHHCTQHWGWPRDYVEDGLWLCPTASKIVDRLSP